MFVHPDVYFANALADHRRTIESSRRGATERNTSGELTPIPSQTKRARRKAFRIAHS